MNAHLRIARPVRDLDRSVRMYLEGLELQEIGRFANHGGFNGVMLGAPRTAYHFEFTECPLHPVLPSPTPEDLLVFYVDDRTEWNAWCERIVRAGFVEVASFNPYWQQRGRTFVDPDGYRVVVQRAVWQAG